MSKGVSEVVATLLMILMVTGIGVGVLLYSMGYFSGISSARQMTYGQDINTLKERFVIVDAKIINNSGAQVVVYNYGEISIKIVGLYVNGVPISINGTTVQINPDQVIWINASKVTLAQNYTAVTVRVVSSLGNFYENLFTLG